MKRSILFTTCLAIIFLLSHSSYALNHEVHGYMLIRGIVGDLEFGKDNDPDKLVDQRFRAKYTISVNDYLKAVYYGEIDFQWGDSSASGGTRNSGGAIGGDTVNLETKNLYMEFKVPDTTITGTLGLQGFGDNFDLALFATDMSGAKFTGSKFGPIEKVTVGWFKLMEGDDNASNGPGASSAEDDNDLYALQVKLSPISGVNLGGDLYYVRNLGKSSGPAYTVIGSREDLYYIGVNAQYKLGDIDLRGWALYNFGTQENVGAGKDDIDVSAYAATVKASIKSKSWNAAARLLYFSGDDDATDTDLNSVRSPFSFIHAVPFIMDGLMIFLPDSGAATYAGPGRFVQGAAMADAGFGANGSAGYGLWGAVVNGGFKPEGMANTYVKAAAGYFSSVVDDREAAGTKREGKNLGAEIALRVGYIMAENLDLSWNGSYAMLGDFYDKTAGGEDPDNPYVTYISANLKF